MKKYIYIVLLCTCFVQVSYLSVTIKSVFKAPVFSPCGFLFIQFLLQLKQKTASAAIGRIVSDLTDN